MNRNERVMIERMNIQHFPPALLCYLGSLFQSERTEQIPRYSCNDHLPASDYCGVDNNGKSGRTSKLMVRNPSLFCLDLNGPII